MKKLPKNKRRSASFSVRATRAELKQYYDLADAYGASVGQLFRDLIDSTRDRAGAVGVPHATFLRGLVSDWRSRPPPVATPEVGEF